MLVVISSPKDVKNEAKIINELFKKGMQLFHVRKPNSTKEEIIELINQIKPEFYKNISLHQFHEMANEFGIKRLHFTSTEREKANLAGNSYIKSCSIHSIEEYNNLDDEIFEYCFLSPVFNSISKPNYIAKTFDLNEKDKTKNIKIVALGGITAENCTKPKEMGFDGIAVLGSIWKEKPVESYLNIKGNYKKIKFNT